MPAEGHFVGFPRELCISQLEFGEALPNPDGRSALPLDANLAQDLDIARKVVREQTSRDQICLLHSF